MPDTSPMLALLAFLPDPRLRTIGQRMLDGQPTTADDAQAVYDGFKALPVVGTAYAERWADWIRTTGAAHAQDLPVDDPRVVAYAKEYGFEVVPEGELKERASFTYAVKERAKEVAAGASALLGGIATPLLVFGGLVVGLVAVVVVYRVAGSGR